MLIIEKTHSYQVTIKTPRLGFGMVMGLVTLVSFFSCFPASADDRFWSKPGSGIFSAPENWMDGFVPGTTDTANFGISGHRFVLFNSNPENLQLNQTAGNLTFRGSPRKYTLTGSGVGVNLTGGSLTLGISGDPFELIANNQLSVNGGNLNVLHGSSASASHFNLGYAGSTSQITVSGLNSKFNLIGSSTTNGIGNAGGTGTLTYQNGATGALAGTLGVGADRNAATHGSLNVLSGSLVETARLNIGTNAGTGLVTVNGSGSMLTQTGSSMLTIGSTDAAHNPGTLNINNGGVFNSGTGLTTVNTTGEILIDNGTFNANGHVDVRGSINVSSNGSVNVAETLRIWDGTGTLNLNTGHVHTSNFDNQGTFNFADGTLSVDGGSFSPQSALANFDIDGATTNSLPKLVLTNGATSQNIDQLRVGVNRNAAVEILSGSTLTTGSSTVSASILGGISADSSGSMLVRGNGSQWNNSGELHVGNLGNGAMNIEAGGVVSTTTGFIGTSSGSTGTATVTGANSVWNSSSLYIGGDSSSAGGNGSLTVANGGSVLVADTLKIWEGTGTLNLNGGQIHTNNFDNRGTFNFNDGTLTVSGGTFSYHTQPANFDIDGATSGSLPKLVLSNGTTSQEIGSLRVGINEHAAVELLSGSTLSAIETRLGANGASSSGSMLVHGSDSQLNNYYLTVGDYGHGAMNIADGGWVRSPGEIVIGHRSGSTGVATVNQGALTGQNFLDPVLTVGYGGHGTLNVQNGWVGSRSSDIGFLAGSTGVATVKNHSLWLNSSELNIGHLGHGTLNIESGSNVESRYGYIGRGSGSTGVVTVTNGGRWSELDELFVGAYGHGSLTINGGGMVHVWQDGTQVGAYAGSSGHVTVSGLFSNFSSGDLYIGSLGQGTMLVNQKGQVSSYNGFIANAAGSSGNATISGLESRWQINGNLSVGSLGDGLLKIESGASVTVGNNTFIGAGGVVDIRQGSLTTQTMTGNGQLLLDSGTLRVTSSAGLSTGIFRNSVVLNSGSLLDVAGPLTVAAASPLVLNGGSLQTGGLHLQGGAIVGTGILNLDQTGGLSGNGFVTTRIYAADPGTTIAATGPLSLGDLSSNDGFNFAGTLIVSSHQVVLNNADRALLGAQTLIDDGGRLSAVNGFNLLSGRELLASGDATIHGDFTHNGSIIGPTGTSQWLTLRDNVDGAGSFSGNIRFTEGYSPGNSSAEVYFGGNLDLANTSLLSIELGGLGFGEFDRLVVNGDVGVLGGMEVSLINGFQLEFGQQFEILSVGGLLSGQFAGLDEGALVGSYGGRDLWITYQGNGGHGVTLFTAVPEPSSASLVGLAAAFGAMFRRRRRCEK